MVIKLNFPINTSLFFTAIPLVTHRNLLLKDLKTKLDCISLESVTARAVSSRSYSGKGKEPSKRSGKTEEVKINMPGFVSPENINEEGYFTQKAKEQLEELKKRLEKPKLTNPEKR